MVGNGVPEAVAAHHETLPEIRAMPSVADPWQEIGPIDVLVVPSRIEGMPNVVLEAFAREVPVIATSAGGNSDLLASDRGLLVPIDDADAIVAALRTIDADPESARQRVARARDYVEAQHSWDRVIRMWDGFLAGCIRNAVKSDCLKR
jgi:glycosyltransferase involved in cell wall biosynthesis